MAVTAQKRLEFVKSLVATGRITDSEGIDSTELTNAVESWLRQRPHTESAVPGATVPVAGLWGIIEGDRLRAELDCRNGGYSFNGAPCNAAAAQRVWDGWQSLTSRFPNYSLHCYR